MLISLAVIFGLSVYGLSLFFYLSSHARSRRAEAEAAYAGEDDTQEFSGRCAAMLSNGKRCPNAALPGSHYCGVPAHQELHGTVPPVLPPEDDGAEEIDEIVTDIVDEVVAEVAETEAVLDAIVEEAVLAGEITVEEAVALEDAIEEAAVEVATEEIAAAVADMAEEDESPAA